MLCKKCNSEINEEVTFCQNCGEKVVINEVEKQIDNDAKINNEKKGDKRNKIIIIVVSVLIIITVSIILCLLLNKKEERKNVLSSIEKDNELRFEIDGQKYYLGSKISEIKKKDLIYDEKYVKENDYILSDNIALQNFSKQDKNIFLGAMYCSNDDKCTYDDSILVKANFYENSGVVVDDFIKDGVSYDDIVDEYGEETGKFYQDDSYLVWILDEKEEIGTPYYVLRFNVYNKVNSIRIGILWYDGEADYIVK